MKYLNSRIVCGSVLPVLLCFCAAETATGGGIAVGDGSELPSENGCMLAFAYNQKGDDRLVVLDEVNRRRYEVPLTSPRKAPFWDGGKVYVVSVDGMMQGFLVSSNNLIGEKEERISSGLILTVVFNREQHRLYLIRSGRDTEFTSSNYELVAINFPARKTLWTKRLDEPGLLTIGGILGPYVCVNGQNLVQVFNCNTGGKLGGIEVPNEAASPAANAKK